MTNIKKRHRKRGIKMRAPFQIFTVIYHKKVRRIYLEKNSCMRNYINDY